LVGPVIVPGTAGAVVVTVSDLSILLVHPEIDLTFMAAAT
jgi:hypothetical protein